MRPTCCRPTLACRETTGTGCSDKSDSCQRSAVAARRPWRSRPTRRRRTGHEPCWRDSPTTSASRPSLKSCWPSSRQALLEYRSRRDPRRDGDQTAPEELLGRGHVRRAVVDASASAPCFCQKPGRGHLPEWHAEAGPLFEVLGQRYVATLPGRLPNAEVLLEGRRAVNGGLVVLLVLVDLVRRTIHGEASLHRAAARRGTRTEPVVDDIKLDERVIRPSIDSYVGPPAAASRLRVGVVC